MVVAVVVLCSSSSSISSSSSGSGSGSGSSSSISSSPHLPIAFTLTVLVLFFFRAADYSIGFILSSSLKSCHIQIQVFNRCESSSCTHYGRRSSSPMVSYCLCLSLSLPYGERSGFYALVRVYSQTLNGIMLGGNVGR